MRDQLEIHVRIQSKKLEVFYSQSRSVHNFNLGGSKIIKILLKILTPFFNKILSKTPFYRQELKFLELKILNPISRNFTPQEPTSPNCLLRFKHYFSMISDGHLDWFFWVRRLSFNLSVLFRSQSAAEKTSRNSGRSYRSLRYLNQGQLSVSFCSANSSTLRQLVILLQIFTCFGGEIGM